MDATGEYPDRADRSEPSLLLVGGPLDGERHEVHSAHADLGLPARIGLPFGDGTRRAWYVVDANLGTAEFDGRTEPV